MRNLAKLTAATGRKVHYDSLPLFQLQIGMNSKRHGQSKMYCNRSIINIIRYNGVMFLGHISVTNGHLIVIVLFNRS